MAEGRPSKIGPSRMSSNPLNKLKLKYQSMDAYSRHKQLINNYCLYYKGSSLGEKFKRDDSKDKNDYDIIRENHKFLWTSEDSSEAEKSWDKMLAKKYYDKLFKEYCIADLSQYEKNRVAMRWRTESEVKTGKGQFICGEKKCEKEKGLESWEVNFAYVEEKTKKHALVKLRLCPGCSAKLNFHSMKKRISKNKRKSEKSKKRHKKRKKERPSSDESSESSEEDAKEGPSEDPEQKRKVEEEKLESEASNVWRKEPEEQRQNPDEEMDKFLDDLLF